MDTDHLEDIVIVSHDDARMYKKALKLLYGKFDTSTDSEEKDGVVLSEHVELIFQSVNNALIAFNEAHDPTSRGNRIQAKKVSKAQAAKLLAASNVLSAEEKKLANCLGVDPDMFFPERGASTREAKEVCRGCVIREGCLAIALIRGEKFGIWGGMSERERRRMRRNGATKRLMEIYGDKNEAIAAEVTEEEQEAI